MNCRNLVGSWQWSIFLEFIEIVTIDLCAKFPKFTCNGIEIFKNIAHFCGRTLNWSTYYELNNWQCSALVTNVLKMSWYYLVTLIMACLLLLWRKNEKYFIHILRFPIVIFPIFLLLSSVLSPFFVWRIWVEGRSKRYINIFVCVYLRLRLLVLRPTYAPVSSIHIHTSIF